MPDSTANPQPIRWPLVRRWTGNPDPRYQSGFPDFLYGIRLDILETSRANSLALLSGEASGPWLYCLSDAWGYLCGTDSAAEACALILHEATNGPGSLRLHLTGRRQPLPARTLQGTTTPGRPKLPAKGANPAITFETLFPEAASRNQGS